MGFADNALTCDGFLGGKLRILQPRAGYRAATDPVFLAAAVPAQAGQSVLELGCGAGVALLSLGHRVPGLQLFGVELQPDYADLAQRNAAANGVACTIHCADLSQMPADLRTQNFDHVIANPPYFPKASGTAAADSGRETAQREALELGIWVKTGLRRLRPGGYLTLIQQADRLPEILHAAQGSIRVLPLAARSGRPANRVIVQIRKGGRTPFQLLAPLVLHHGAAHMGDFDSHTATARAVLRAGQPLILGEHTASNQP
ncbi:MAG: methyltransferase domain-containing protein [Paracoccaceae bacterium]|nr:methyltransferase domain-containing protein [Paracoccaceae bacterium]